MNLQGEPLSLKDSLVVVPVDDGFVLLVQDSNNVRITTSQLKAALDHCLKAYDGTGIKDPWETPEGQIYSSQTKHK